MIETSQPPTTNNTKARRKQTLVTVTIAVLVFGGILLGLYLTDPERQLPDQSNQVSTDDEVSQRFSLPGQQVDPREVWISRGEADISSLKQSNTEFGHTIEELREEISILRQDQARTDRSSATRSMRVPPPIQRADKPTAFPALPLPPAPQAQAMQSGEMMDRALSDAAGRTATNLGVQTKSQTIAPPAILSVSLLDNSATGGKTKDGKTKKERCNISNCIPPGAFATAALLSGLDAPTGGRADTNPHPVLLELLDTASLPNRYRSRVKECRIVAAGFGRISDERAYLRLERLSCVLRGGEILDVPIKGYVSGEDGKNGMRGHLISKQGALVARALLAGTAGGIGQALSQSYSNILTSPTGAVSTIDPSKTLEFGVASGFGTALEKISDWYLKRADETYPIIEIDAGRVVEIVLTEGVELGVNLEEKHTL
jgi:conjugal transfer pilus assembly protein TraB